MRFKLTIILLLASLTLPTAGFFAFGASAAEQKPTMSKNSIIVQFKNKISPTVIPVRKGESAARLIERYSTDPAVIYAEPNFIYRASMIPSDSYYPNQWYLKRIKAAEAWDIRSTSPGVVIAIIDSGVQTSHPDLKANMWVNAAEIDGNKKDDDHNGFIDDVNGWDFVNNVADPSPKFKPGFTEAGILHGTIVAGIAAGVGNNNQGITGISWDAKIMALKALDDQGDGDTATVIKAIDYAVAKGANIINLSFVGFSYSRSLKEALQRAYNAGVLVVAPAGNEQSDGHGVNLNEKPIYPACYRDEQNRPLVVGVAATDGIDQKATFSGYGDRCIDVAAPGVSFFSTAVYSPQKSYQGQFFNTYYDGYWSGTSVAVPLVSGALALVQGANPTLSAKESLDIILQTADDINALNPEYVNQLGRGRLNIALALAEATARLKKTIPQFAFARSQGLPEISIADINGNVQKTFMAYKPTFKGGITIAGGDLEGDADSEIISAPMSGLEADIRIFDKNGKFKNHFLAYPATYKGGVNIVAADLNNDGKSEIITAPASGMRSEIKVFSGQGKLLRSFLAYPASFTGGASIAVGDVSGDSALEIVTGTGKGGIPQVKVFSSNGKMLNTFLANPDRKATGLRIALLDIDGNSRRRQSEILVTRQSGSPLASIFDLYGNKRKEWLAYDPAFKSDVKAATFDLNSDGLKEIAFSPGGGGGPHIRIFNRLGQFRRSFYAYPLGMSSGVNLAVFTIKR